MTCLHNHDQILEFLRKIFLKGFQIYQNYLCALKLKKEAKSPCYFIIQIFQIKIFIDIFEWVHKIDN